VSAQVLATLQFGTPQTFAFAVGEDGVIQLRGVGPCDGSTFALTLRRHATAPALSRWGNIVDITAGDVDFPLVDVDTLALEPGRYLLDIWQTDIDGNDRQVVKALYITLLPSVRQPADVPTTPTPQALVAYGLPSIASAPDGSFIGLQGGELAWVQAAEGHVERGIVPFDGTSTLASVTFNNAFADTAYKYQLTVYPANGVPVVAYLSTKRTTDMTIAVTDTFTGEVSWEART
jgi:hypothetical protein